MIKLNPLGYSVLVSGFVDQVDILKEVQSAKFSLGISFLVTQCYLFKEFPVSPLNNNTNESSTFSYLLYFFTPSFWTDESGSLDLGFWNPKIEKYIV